MPRLLLAWELGSGLGHCVKLAPLAEGLLDLGHEVYFAARDLVTARRVVRAGGIKHLQAPVLLGKPATPIREPRSFSQILHNVGFGDDGQLDAMVCAWRGLLELVRPDVIVCEHAPFALLASRWTPARRIVMGTGFSLPPDVSPLPDLLPWLGHPPSDLIELEAAILDRVNRLLLPDGLAPLERLSQIYSKAQESLLMTFPELDHHGVRREAKYWGSWSPPGGVNVDWPSGDGPRVFAYLKASFGPWRVESVLNHLRELALRVVAHVPDCGPEALQLQSPMLRISTDRIDVSAQLQSCDLAILNGTAGAGTQCLLAGVPVLMLPLYMEQIVFSRRVFELGAGLVAEPHRLNKFDHALQSVLGDRRYRDRAREFAQCHAGYSAAQHQRDAVQIVDSSLTSKNGVG